LYFLQNGKKRVSCSDQTSMKDIIPKEIKAELDNVHSTSAPAFTIVYN